MPASDRLKVDPNAELRSFEPLRVTLALGALLLGFLIPYLLYLNHQVGERFGKLRWQVPTRVYARPLVLRQGLALDAQTLKTELDAASYRDGDGQRPGTYARSGARWLRGAYAEADGLYATLARLTHPRHPGRSAKRGEPGPPR